MHPTVSTRLRPYKLLSPLKWQTDTLLENTESRNHLQKKKKRNHLSLERACVEKQMPEPWSIISPSGSSIRISNTSETLSILASLDSCAASFFLIGYSFRWKIDKVLKCENILTRLIQCNLNLVVAVSEKL